ncbi:MAG: bifunctional glutamate N-acetyltransferase/amino-acid acetyltransferase ArgJ, partial [Chloroflexi bacterium]|nr:bifunctional glutamate N-acetyltransferase/amino-acid acetyltransferase ArgJ [Chloroflexota bacterium]
MSLEPLPQGTITSPRGYLAGACYAGIKTAGEKVLDLGVLYSEASCQAAGLFTTNKVKAAPVLVSQHHLDDGRAQAIVVNSGCANAATGERGLKDAATMATLVGRKLGVSPQDVVVASTGVIGVPLPMDKIGAAVEKIALSRDGGHDLARAITTTDTFPKEVAFSRDGMVVAGIAKGAGMIHPNLATLLCFLSTDANLELGFMKRALHRAVDVSFNMITIDGDTSTNDTVVLLANGLASGEKIEEGTSPGGVFEEMLKEVCIHLAKAVARDGEGATKLITVTVEGALTATDARAAARTVVGSPLVKAAVHG